MPTSPQKLSPGEFEVLKILWKLNLGTVAEVRQAYDPHRGMRPAYTTTMTVLGRLVEKNAARVDKDTQPFVYRPAIRRAPFLRRRLREFIEANYEGDTDLLLEDLLGDAHVSAEDLQRVARDSRE